MVTSCQQDNFPTQNFPTLLLDICFWHHHGTYMLNERMAPPWCVDQPTEKRSSRRVDQCGRLNIATQTHVTSLNEDVRW
ncbi:hypothetical protein EB796_025080 [Bugula neritina]|uniref:Uncharacterized protein n=1 Tax=Bugula neritina TaxID=10212 RepID=A0A7J7ISQ8_BUGNE|nr:hypothetical protein EB796_025080 [Bugula neritina]